VKTRTAGRLTSFALLSAIVLALLGGCGTVDISDKRAYDKYYADSRAEQAAATSTKFVFYVPYRQFDITRRETGDTTPVLDALKTVFGGTISFEESTSAPYLLDVKSVRISKNEGITARSRIVANLTAKGKTRELTAEYDMEEWSLGMQHVYTMYRATALDLAKQVKNWVDPQVR
jgi:archaellum component FlaF (FlaF/FlaG flagellin family)